MSIALLLQHSQEEPLPPAPGLGLTNLDVTPSSQSGLFYKLFLGPSPSLLFVFSLH